jgi:hypothetical protein
MFGLITPLAHGQQAKCDEKKVAFSMPMTTCPTM